MNQLHLLATNIALSQQIKTTASKKILRPPINSGKYLVQSYLVGAIVEKKKRDFAASIFLSSKPPSVQ